MATDLPDWSRQVEITAGQITATIVGPVTVTGTVDIGTAVTVTSITNPITVASVTNAISIAANQTVNVKTAGSTNVVIAGSVSITGTPAVSITGTPTVDIGSGVVNATITNSSIAITATSVPVTNVVGGILNVGDQLTIIGTHTFSAPTTSFNHTFTAPTFALGALVIVIHPSTTSATVYECVVIGSVATALQFVAPFGVDNANRAIAIVPAATEAGLNLVISVYASGASTGTVTMAVYGFTSNPGVLLRADGRTHPIGSREAVVTNNVSSTVTLIAAPTGSRRILLQSLSLLAAPVAVTQQGQITGTRLGTARNLAVIYATATTKSAPFVPYNVPIPEQGLLMDAATPITMANGATSAGNWLARASYDIVV